MIIPDPDEEKAAAQLEESRAAAEAAELKDDDIPSDDPPPNYTEIHRSATASSNPGHGPVEPELAPNIKPTNFVVLSSMNDSVKGTWAIDPTMYIPSALLPPLEHGSTEATRPNMCLKSANGSVDATIYIVAPADTSRDDVRPKLTMGKRAIIQATSRNGSVTVKIKEIPGASVPRVPLHITAESLNGRIMVYLPRAFTGPIRAKTLNGTVKYSPGVEAAMTRFSDVGAAQRVFLGRFEPAKWIGVNAANQWEGDELVVEGQNGSIFVHYVDELSNPRAKTGFFGRLFG